MALTEVYCLVNRARGMEVRWTWTATIKTAASVLLFIELIRSDPDLLPSSIKSEADDGTAIWRVESKLSDEITAWWRWLCLHIYDNVIFSSGSSLGYANFINIRTNSNWIYTFILLKDVRTSWLDNWG